MAAVAGPPCEPVPSGRLSTGQFDLGWENSIRLAFDLCSSVSSPLGNTKVPTRIRNLEWNQSYCSSPFFLFWFSSVQTIFHVLLSFFFFPFAHQEFGMESISCSSPFYLFFSFMWTVFFSFPFASTDNSNPYNWEGERRWVVMTAKKRWCYLSKPSNQT